MSFVSTIFAVLALQSADIPIADEGPGIVAALTQETVEIRSNFAGAELILYGAVRGLEDGDDIVVVVRGPAQDLRVMRKARTFGIWVNRAPVRFEDVPGYYTVASTRPLTDIGAFTALRRSGIGLDHLRLSAPETERQEVRFGVEVTVSEIGEEIADYRGAIARMRRNESLFSETSEGVDIIDGGLFRAVVALPPSTPVGEYTADVYLFRNGQPVALRSIGLDVHKAGLERIIYNFAYEHSMLYGLVAVALALLFGWGAAAIFSRR